MNADQNALEPAVLLVRPRSLGEETDRIVERLRERHRVGLMDDPRDLAAVTRNEWDVVAGPGSMPCDSAFFDRLPRIRAVVAVGSGIEGIDREAASQRGILIGDGAVKENARDMASATVLLMLALLHDLDGARACLAGGAWLPRKPRARALGDQIIGLIGFGRVGRAVARHLAPWKPRILIAAPRAGTALPPRARVATLEEVLARSDVVSVHASLNASTRDLLDARAIGRMKSTAMLINTARGGIVDESAVAEALDAGRLRAAAFDCFAQEPLPPDSPLRNARNVILTPHAIGQTIDGGRAVAAMFEENIFRTLRGDRPCSLRNPAALHRRPPPPSTTS